MEPHLTPKQLAERLGLKKKTLAQWRQKGKGPAYIKMGDGKTSQIRYRIEDVEAYEKGLKKSET